MAYLIGTDEAGYGPNLGPLVISASVWRVADDMLRQNLYETLADCVCTAADRDEMAPRVAIADSKQLYKPGGGLGALECGVLAAVGATGAVVSRWRQIWACLDPGCGAFVEAEPWHAGYDAPLPRAVEVERLNAARECLTRGLDRAGVELRRLRSVVIFPQQWNDLLDEHEGKAAALSYCSLNLVRELLAPLEPAPVLVVCDKHGGRNRYAPLLQHFFPDDFVETHAESLAASIYRWGRTPHRVEARFMAKGESFLPSALASMTSKYLRELAMAAFNEFWRLHLPNLKPTAGYPSDARRFKNDIAEVQQALGIPDRQLWRNR